MESSQYTKISLPERRKEELEILLKNFVNAVENFVKVLSYEDVQDFFILIDTKKSYKDIFLYLPQDAIREDLKDLWKGMICAHDFLEDRDYLPFVSTTLIPKLILRKLSFIH